MNDWDDIYAQGSAMTSAILGTNYDTITVSNTASNTTIKGKMLCCNQDIDLDLWQKADRDAVKTAMISKIVEELIKSKMVEFTQECDAINHVVKIRARLFVTPDDQVRILRKAGY